MDELKNTIPEEGNTLPETNVSAELIAAIQGASDEEVRISGRTHNLRDMPNRYRIEEGSGIHPNPRY